MNHPATGSLHHVELWVPDLARARQQWGWLPGQLGYEQYQNWEHGRSWRFGSTYLVIEQSPTLTATSHDRLRPGLNHLAFHAGGQARVDALTGARVAADCRARCAALLGRHPLYPGIEL